MRWKSALAPTPGAPVTVFAAELRTLVETKVHADTSNGDFARMCNISAGSLSTAMTGKSLPSTEMLEAILKSAGVSAPDKMQWHERRNEVQSRITSPKPTPDGSPEDLKAFVALHRSRWEESDPGDPDYRVHSRLLGRDDLFKLFRVAARGGLDSQDMAYLVASALYWGHRYVRWIDVSGKTPEVAEVLVDNIAGPFRRVRWRSAWTLQTFPEPLRAQAIALVDEIWTATLAPEEIDRVAPLLVAIGDERVEDLLRESDDPDLERDQVRRSLLNEFRSELVKPGARGRLSSSS